MTRDLAAPALVLLDEVGAGTDPTEGGALGVAIVDHFRQRGALVVATTHHGLMKAYAQSTPGVACASFGYDPDTYEPTYQLAMGVAGRSLALEMAERLGLPAAALTDARSRLDVREAQAEALLKKLEEDNAQPARGSRSASPRSAQPFDGRARRPSSARGTSSKTASALELTAFKKDLQKRGEDAVAQGRGRHPRRGQALGGGPAEGHHRRRPGAHRGHRRHPRSAGRSAGRSRYCCRGGEAGGLPSPWSWAAGPA